MKHHQTHYRAAAAFVSISGLVLGLVLADRYEPAPAFANDDKIFAPQFCMPQSEPGYNDVAGEFGNALIDPWTIMQVDVENGYQTFICPLVRDIVAGRLDDVWVRLVNNAPQEPFPPECCVYSVSLNGNLSDFECQTSNNVIHGPLTLHFSLDSFTEYDFGHYSVLCDLGHADHIVSIRTSESD
jgi:hypothetical protein